MNGVNRVHLVGTVGKQPEVKHFEGGNTAARFSLATNKSWKDKDGNKQEKVSWHNITVWGPRALLVEKYVTKGMNLYIEGEINYGEYEKDGVKKYFTEIIASDFVFVGKKEAQSDAQATAPSEPVKDTFENQATGNDVDDLPF